MEIAKLTVKLQIKMISNISQSVQTVKGVSSNNSMARLRGETSGVLFALSLRVLKTFNDEQTIETYNMAHLCYSSRRFHR